MTTSTLSSLVERVMEAKGPDREIDLLISWEVGKHGTTAQHRDARAFFERHGRMPGEKSLRWLPHYTASLDAAMGLVPEWCQFIEIIRYSDGWYVRLAKHSASDTPFMARQAPTAQAGVVAASLRAMEQMKSKTKEG